MAARLAILEKLVALNPENVDWELDLGAVLNRIGWRLIKAGQSDEALKIFQRDLKGVEKVLAIDPNGVVTPYNLGLGSPEDVRLIPSGQHLFWLDHLAVVPRTEFHSYLSLLGCQMFFECLDQFDSFV